MLIFLVFMLLYMAVHPFVDYVQWREWVAQPGITLVFLLFFVALLSHMRVGLRDVLLDYAKPAAVRNVLLTLVALGLCGLGGWVLVILLGLKR